MKNMTNTQFFQVESGPQISAKDILEIVYKALSEKGYNPVNQIVRLYYVRRSDLTSQAITGARSLIMKMERDELVEEMLKTYIEHNEWGIMTMRIMGLDYGSKTVALRSVIRWELLLRE